MCIKVVIMNDNVVDGQATKLNIRSQGPARNDNLKADIDITGEKVKIDT